MLAALVAAPASARAQVIVWDTDEHPYPSIQLRTGHLVNPVRNFYAVFIDLCAEHVRVIATAPAATRQTTGTWAAGQGVQLAVNGDFFQYVTPPSVYGDAVGGGIRWPLAQTGVDDGWAWYYRKYGWVAAGDGWIDFSHSEYVKNNRAAFEAAGFQVSEGWSPHALTTDVPPGTRALVSGFSELVIQGRVNGCPDPLGNCFADRGDMSSSHLRTAIGISQDRTQLIFVIAINPVLGVQLAEIMAAVGAWQAFNLDGGGSSTLWLDQVGYLFPTGTVRAVANHWGVYASPNTSAEPRSCHVRGGCYPTPLAEAASEPFLDFPSSFTGHDEAIDLVSSGVATSCDAGPMFCPRCAIRRREIAGWLVSAAGLPLVSTSTPSFSDVPLDDPDFAVIETLLAAGITSGCGNGSFCPDAPVTREQGAAFIRRARGWTAIAPPAPSYRDVAPGSTFYEDIETITGRCITSGCGAGAYCPGDPLERGEAAVFVARAWDIDDANPCFDCTPELCNGSDDNCDGAIDEGCPPLDAGAIEDAGDTEFQEDAAIDDASIGDAPSDAETEDAAIDAEIEDGEVEDGESDSSDQGAIAPAVKDAGASKPDGSERIEGCECSAGARPSRSSIFDLLSLALALLCCRALISRRGERL